MKHSKMHGKPTQRGSARGFSLVEVMLVVGIMGIMASIALPKVQLMTANSKKAERNIMFPTIRISLVDYYNTHDSLFPNTLQPGVTWTQGLQDPTAVTYDSQPFDPSQAGWNILTLVPDGWCRYRYSFLAYSDPQDLGPGNLIQLTATSDVDGDGEIETYVENWNGSSAGWTLQWPPSDTCSGPITPTPLVCY